MTLDECTRLSSVYKAYSITMGAEALVIEFSNPQNQRSEIYRFSDDGRLHHWVGADDTFHQGTDHAFNAAYRRLEKAGFFSGKYVGSVGRMKEAMVSYACRLRDQERRAAQGGSIDTVVHASFPPSAASEAARRREARNDVRDALGLPRL